MIARLIFAALLLLPSLAQAQMVFRPWTHGTPPAGGTPYTGPCDIATGTPVVAYGLRACSGTSDVTGSVNAIQLRRGDNNTTYNILLTSSGDLDVATAATDCSGTTCYVATLYCLGGCGTNATQTTGTNQPQFKFNCNGTHPCIYFDGGFSEYFTASITSTAQPITFADVAYGISPGSADSIMMSSGPASFATILQLDWHGGFGANPRMTCGISATSMQETLAAGNWFGAEGICNSTGSFFSVNGTEATGGGTQTDPTGTPLVVGARAADLANPVVGYMEEAQVFHVALTNTSGGTARSVCHNASVYWGGFTC